MNQLGVEPKGVVGLLFPRWFNSFGVNTTVVTFLCAISLFEIASLWDSHHFKDHLQLVVRSNSYHDKFFRVNGPLMYIPSI